MHPWNDCCAPPSIPGTAFSPPRAARRPFARSWSPSFWRCRSRSCVADAGLEAAGAHRRGAVPADCRAAEHRDREARRSASPPSRSADRAGQGHGLGRGRACAGHRRDRPGCWRWPSASGSFDCDRRDCRRRARRARPMPMNARPTDRLAIAVAQLNPTVGDIAGNADKARARARRPPRDGADLVVLPGAVPCRLSARGPRAQAGLPGGLPRRDRGACARDRRWRPGAARRHALGRGAASSTMPVACSTAAPSRRCASRSTCRITACSTSDGVFAPGPPPGAGQLPRRAPRRPDLRGHLDRWGDYEDVVETLAETGAELLVVPNGSPYSRDKDDVRLNIAVARVIESGLPIIYANQVGGQDELVFDGASFGLHADRSLAFQMPAFEEVVTTLRWERRRQRLALRRRPDRGDRRRATRRTTAPACWACATTSTRTASRASCSACPAASTPRCARRWRSMRSAPSACTA